MKIIQVVPEVKTGSGVEAVAYHLQQEWVKAGHEVGRFTLAEAHGGWLGTPGRGIVGKLVLAARVVWFSTVGTLLGRAMSARQGPDTVIITHNDAVVGDVYVNHGIVAAAMKARGHAWARMLRNPLHLFTYGRDAARFAGHTHKVVVNLCSQEEVVLRRTYPRIAPRTAVIGNGVDVERFRPDPDRGRAVRAALGIPADARVALFVGHEFDRKGLPAVLGALEQVDQAWRLIVVGGTEDMVADTRASIRNQSVRDRVFFVGRQPDPRDYFHASDVLVSPSQYESYGLVVLEGLSCGLPVLASPVGCVPDVIDDGVNGFVTGFDAGTVAEALRRYAAGDARALSAAARATAERHTWAAEADRYLELFETLRADRTA